jgi:pSer/pThr/pTyr-binding forkhead associated (FHA) protein
MLLLQLRSGNESRAQVISKFPCVIGRSNAADFILSEAGVWERHLVIDCDSETKKFSFAAAEPEAIVFRNNERQQKGEIRNGDTFKLGAAEIQISLARAQQQGLSGQEVFAWSLLALVAVTETVLLIVLQK